MPVTDRHGNVIYRLADLDVMVEEVKEGDFLFGMQVRHSEPQSDFIWRLEALTDDEEAGIVLQMTSGHYVTVRRSVPLLEDQCITCGRQGVKYAARHQCSACYQREHRRAARRPASRGRDQELPFPA